MAIRRKLMKPQDNAVSNLRSPLAGWMGGKFRLSKRVVSLLPAHTCYCEPFAGAAWVLFRKPESEVEVINDINREIVAFYRVVQYHLEEFVRYFKWVLIARDEFERLKRVAPDTLTDIQRAARFYYLQQMCFGGRMNDRPTFGYAAVRGPKLNLLRIEERLSEAHLRLARAYIECLPYHDVIKRYDKPETLFYIDPPYWDCEDYYGKGLFSRDDFARLAKLLGTIEGKFILSLNDRPEMRELFAGLAIETAEVAYTCTNGKNLKAPEVIIRNFD